MDLAWSVWKGGRRRLECISLLPPSVTLAPYSTVASWADRAVPATWGVTPAGVPLEYMAALVRATSAPAAWFSVPQAAAKDAAVAAGASFLRNFTRLLVDELLAGAVAEAVAAAAGGGASSPLPAAWQAVAPGLSSPVQLPAAAPGSAEARAARNLSLLVVQYSSEVNFYSDTATAAAQVRRGSDATGAVAEGRDKKAQACDVPGLPSSPPPIASLPCSRS